MLDAISERGAKVDGVTRYGGAIEAIIGSLTVFVQGKHIEKARQLSNRFN